MTEEPIRTDLDEAPGFRIWHGQPYESMSPHWHDQVEINYAVGGSLTYLLAGSVVSVPPGRLSLFWAGMPHGVVSSTGVEKFYWVYVPLVWVLRMELPGPFMQRLMTGEMAVDGDPLESDRTMLDRWSSELPRAGDARRRLIIREVEARVMRFALSQVDEASSRYPPARNSPVRKVSEMARFIAENYGRSLQLKEVAEYVGLHPNYAMTLFKRHYGMTLSAYLTRLRVCQAQNLLISTDQDASQIALNTGFGSISRFYESFKAVSGSTPRRYRMQSQLRD